MEKLYQASGSKAGPTWPHCADLCTIDQTIALIIGKIVVIYLDPQVAIL